MTNLLGSFLSLATAPEAFAAGRDYLVPDAHSGSKLSVRALISAA